MSDSKPGAIDAQRATPATKIDFPPNPHYRNTLSGCAREGRRSRLYVRGLIYHADPALRLRAVVMPDGTIEVLESLATYARRIGRPVDPSRRGLAGRQAIARRRAERDRQQAAAAQ